MLVRREVIRNRTDRALVRSPFDWCSACDQFIAPRAPWCLTSERRATTRMGSGRDSVCVPCHAHTLPQSGDSDNP